MEGMAVDSIDGRNKSGDKLMYRVNKLSSSYSTFTRS